MAASGVSALGHRWVVSDTLSILEGREDVVVRKDDSTGTCPRNHSEKRRPTFQIGFEIFRARGWKIKL